MFFIRPIWIEWLFTQRKAWKQSKKVLIWTHFITTLIKVFSNLNNYHCHVIVVYLLPSLVLKWAIVSPLAPLQRHSIRFSFESTCFSTTWHILLESQEYHPVIKRRLKTQVVTGDGQYILEKITLNFWLTYRSDFRKTGFQRLNFLRV